MSRTIGGYNFICKACGYMHILTKGFPHDGIRVPCAENQSVVKEYSKTDFEFFHGMVTWNMIFNSVKEVEE